MSKPLEYYFKDGSHVKFDKYTIDTSGIVMNNITGEVLSTQNNEMGYNVVNVVSDTGKRRKILIGRAIVSTFGGRPPTLIHTADHIDRDTNNDTVENLRWGSSDEQANNRVMPETLKSAFIIIRNGIEKTSKEWLEYLKDQKNLFGRDYTGHMIREYARNNLHGFSYKKYPDLEGEVWKDIICSKNAKGDWKISNMNRVKYATKHAENVLSEDRLGLKNGYPRIVINGRDWLCHILVFKTFFPEEYGAKKNNEFILHEDDNKLDFRPHKLRIGTQSENCIDAHNNGCYSGTKSSRMSCASYINGEFEKEHDGQREAARYLKSIGFEKADYSSIGKVLREQMNTAYGRTWKLVNV
jgi:hypothetical protein